MTSDMKTLECGSGLSTFLFFALGSDHTALEDKEQYAPPLSSVQIRPLVGDPEWYDWYPDGPYDFILVDGPHPSIRRWGILRVIDQLVHDKTILMFDDTERGRDRSLSHEVAIRLGRQRTIIAPTCSGDFGKKVTLL